MQKEQTSGYITAVQSVQLSVRSVSTNLHRHVRTGLFDCCGCYGSGSSWLVKAGRLQDSAGQI